MKKHIIATATCLVLIGLTVTNCRKSSITPRSQTSESLAIPSRTLSFEEMSDLPQSVHGRPLPLDINSGLVFGLTLDASQNCNFALANAMKESFLKHLKMRIQTKKDPFFIAIAVNLEHLGIVTRVGAKLKIKTDTSSEIEAFVKDLNGAHAEIANQNLLVFNDTNKSLHKAFNISVPRAPSETTPISVTVVGQGGRIFETFSVAESGDALNATVEKILASLRAAEVSSPGRYSGPQFSDSLLS
jgi:hypothetical protein